MQGGRERIKRGFAQNTPSETSLRWTRFGEHAFLDEFGSGKEVVGELAAVGVESVWTYTRATAYGVVGPG